MKMSYFERQYSLGYRHMIFIGKTKSTGDKGLLVLSVNFGFDNQRNYFQAKIGFSSYNYCVQNHQPKSITTINKRTKTKRRKFRRKKTLVLQKFKNVWYIFMERFML